MPTSTAAPMTLASTTTITIDHNRTGATSVAWQAGDILVIDNRRMMHGRNACGAGETHEPKSEERTIDVRLGMRAFT